MVLQKKMYHGFNGYQIPPMPRGSRSARGKRSFPKKNKENPLFAFEMLAMVAGKLLLEKETPKLSSIVPVCSKLPKGIIKHESWKVEKQLKVEPCDQGSCDESTLVSESLHERIDQISKLKGLKCSQTVIQQPASLTVKSELFMKTHKELRFPIVKSSKDDEIGDSFPLSGNCCARTYSPGTSESDVTKVEDETQVPLPTDRQTVTDDVDGTGVNLFCMEDPVILDPEPPSMDSSDSSVEARPAGLYISNNHFIANDHDRVELVDRDDDENSSRCTLPSTIFLKAFRSQHTEDRKTRKLMASKFWKVGPTLLRDSESSNNDEQVKPIFRSRRMCYTRQRSQRSSFKRKRLLEHSTLPSSGCSLANTRVFDLADKASMKEASFMSTVLYGGHKLQSESEDVQVKFSIKSLKIPEIIIDMPETATVGELKRAVLESVTAVLHDGLRVGIILQGKKVKDDNKTLLQAGLSNGVKTDSLGFSLEPKKLRAQSQLTESESPHFLPQCDSIESLSRLPVADSGLPSSTNDLGRSSTECPGNYARYADKPATEPPAACTTLTDDDNSRALVAVPAMAMDALAVVPFQRKSRRSELVQRRIRRPFSVAEVEALVHAVEVLGTGRWRDVKLRAFEDAKHRTYVDLKDKWKTLVHTARISPQQRRGEPVPQELLDRVLSAHAYWSNQQAKLQIKQHPEQNLLI